MSRSQPKLPACMKCGHTPLLCHGRTKYTLYLDGYRVGQRTSDIWRVVCEDDSTRPAYATRAEAIMDWINHCGRQIGEVVKKENEA